MKRSNSTLWLLLGIGILVVAFFYATSQSINVIASFLESPTRSERSSSLNNADIAVLPLEGIIMGSNEWLDRLKSIEKRDNIKAVIIRIDSPGGAVSPSQDMFRAVLKLRDKKRVFCSMGDLAASGGYYVAAACEKIFANSGTLTGSIGVIMNLMNLQRLYDWAKVEPLTLKAGRYKDIASSSRPMREDEKKLLQDMLDSIHSQFKQDIQKGRESLSQEQLDMYADGRIFTGLQAHELGFVDHIGGVQDLVDFLQNELGLEDEPKVAWVKEKKSRLASLFEERMQPSGAGMTSQILQAIGQWAPALRPELETGKPYLLPYYWFESSQGPLSR